MEAPYGRMLMCHMVADSTQELLDMVRRIGVAKKWIQDAGTYEEHFDVCKAKRALAVKHGAIEITMGRVGVMLQKRKALEAKGLPWNQDHPGALPVGSLDPPDGDGFNYDD